MGAEQPDLMEFSIEDLHELEDLFGDDALAPARRRNGGPDGPKNGGPTCCLSADEKAQGQCAYPDYDNVLKLQNQSTRIRNQLCAMATVPLFWNNLGARILDGSSGGFYKCCCTGGIHLFNKFTPRNGCTKGGPKMKEAYLWDPSAPKPSKKVA